MATTIKPKNNAVKLLRSELKDTRRREKAADDEKRIATSEAKRISRAIEVLRDDKARSRRRRRRRTRAKAKAAA